MNDAVEGSQFLSTVWSMSFYNTLPCGQLFSHSQCHELLPVKIVVQPHHHPIHVTSSICKHLTSLWQLQRLYPKYVLNVKQIGRILSHKYPTLSGLFQFYHKFPV